MNSGNHRSYCSAGRLFETVLKRNCSGCRLPQHDIRRNAHLLVRLSFWHRAQVLHAHPFCVEELEEARDGARTCRNSRLKHGKQPVDSWLQLVYGLTDLRPAARR